MEIEELIVKAVDAANPMVECSNDAADLFMSVGRAITDLDEFIADPLSPFDLDNSEKLRKNLVKAVDAIVSIQEPKFSARIEISLKEASEFYEATETVD